MRTQLCSFPLSRRLKRLALVTVTTTATLLAGAAQAATSSYAVQHTFGFWSSNWANVFTPVLSYANYYTYAQANNVVDSSQGSGFFLNSFSIGDTSHARSGTAEAWASASASLYTTNIQFPGFWGSWPNPPLSYVWGQTSSSGLATTLDNTDGFARAQSSATLVMGRLNWGRNGRLFWSPFMASTVGGSVTAWSRRLRDPIEIEWQDAQGENQVEQLLDINLSGGGDPSVFEWNAGSGSLLLGKSAKDVHFTIGATSSWLDQQGSLDLAFNAASQLFSLNATGLFAGVTGAYDAQTELYSLNLGEIDLAYTAPVDTYNIRFGGGGDGAVASAVPEPASLALLLAGLVAVCGAAPLVRDRRESVAAV